MSSQFASKSPNTFQALAGSSISLPSIQVGNKFRFKNLELDKMYTFSQTPNWQIFEGVHVYKHLIEGAELTVTLGYKLKFIYF
jgi:hypothetical protein